MPANATMVMSNLSTLVYFDYFNFIDLESIPILYEFMLNNEKLKDLIPLND